MQHLYVAAAYVNQITQACLHAPVNTHSRSLPHHLSTRTCWSFWLSASATTSSRECNCCRGGRAATSRLEAAAEELVVLLLFASPVLLPGTCCWDALSSAPCCCCCCCCLPTGEGCGDCRSWSGVPAPSSSSLRDSTNRLSSRSMCLEPRLWPAVA